eukprot:COSAG01_NODE_146_length_24099_cov_25.341208_36_plen_85_part_00
MRMARTSLTGPKDRHPEALTWRRTRARTHAHTLSGTTHTLYVHGDASLVQVLVPPASMETLGNANTSTGSTGAGEDHGIDHNKN